MMKKLEKKNCYVAGKRIVSNKQRYQYEILIAQIEDLNEDHVKFSRPFFPFLFFFFTFREISPQRPSRSGRAGSVYRFK